MSPEEQLLREILRQLAIAVRIKYPPNKPPKLIKTPRQKAKNYYLAKVMQDPVWVKKKAERIQKRKEKSEAELDRKLKLAKRRALNKILKDERIRQYQKQYRERKRKPRHH